MSDGLSAEQELLLHELDGYRGADPTEEEHRRTIRALVASDPLWWHRDTLPGHVTASAFVVSTDLGSVLLHHHRRLDRWLQFGGHDEGEQHPAKAVLRELEEESGLQHVSFFGHPVFFDLDVHPIPATGSMPAHRHLDVRYLMVADRDQDLRPAEGESQRLRWFPVAETARLLDDGGGARVCRKLLHLGEGRGVGPVC